MSQSLGWDTFTFLLYPNMHSNWWLRDNLFDKSEDVNINCIWLCKSRALIEGFVSVLLFYLYTHDMEFIFTLTCLISYIWWLCDIYLRLVCYMLNFLFLDVHHHVSCTKMAFENFRNHKMVLEFIKFWSKNKKKSKF